MDAGERGVLRARAGPVPPDRRRRAPAPGMVRAAPRQPQGHDRGRRLPPPRSARRLAGPARAVAHRLELGGPDGRRPRRRLQRGCPGRGRRRERHAPTTLARPGPCRPRPVCRDRAALRRAALGPGARDRRHGRAGPGAAPRRKQAVTRPSPFQPARVAGRVIRLLRDQRGHPDPALLHAVRRPARGVDRRHGRAGRPRQRGHLAPARQRPAAWLPTGVVPRGRDRRALLRGPGPAHRGRGRRTRTAQRGR